MHRTAHPIKPVVELPPLEWSPPAFEAPSFAAPSPSTTVVDFGRSAEGWCLWQAAIFADKVRPC